MHLPRRQAVLSAIAWIGHGFAMRRGLYRVDKVVVEFLGWALTNLERRRPMEPRVMRRIRDMGGVAWR